MVLGYPDVALDDDTCVTAWAASGAMHLTGPASGPPAVSPAGIVRPLLGLGDALASATGRLGTEVRVDPVALVAQRAAFTGFGRDGSRSAGGFAQMVRALDGWVALNLPRPSDTEALPALVGAPVAVGDWSETAAQLATMDAAEVVDRASLLGMAVAAVGETVPPAVPWTIHRERPARARGSEPVVVDLTSLWAGPLAGQVLAAAGCRVLKVESVSRPDGARRGPAGFFELLNRQKQHLRMDLPEPEALDRLQELIAGADLVLEASRPRVMQQWGICPDQVVAAGTAWVSITGHGAPRTQTATGSPSVTMPPSPADWSCRVIRRCSWAMPSPIPSPAWPQHRSPRTCWLRAGPPGGGVAGIGVGVGRRPRGRTH